MPSVWDLATSRDPSSHKKGSITKTCFVYAAPDGWDWKPYENEVSIGALSQEIAGKLGLKYEEIPCDAALPSKLSETRDHDVPTVLFAEPSGFSTHPIETAMRDYDNLFLLNCGLIVAWEQSTPLPATDPRWHYVRLNVCPQKTTAPPPHHEWLSTASASDLRTKSAAIIEGIRGQLLKKLLGSDTITVLKAESPELSRRAEEEQGLRLDTAPQLAPVASA